MANDIRGTSSMGNAQAHRVVPPQVRRVVMPRAPHEAFAAADPGVWHASGFSLGTLPIPDGLVYIGTRLLDRTGQGNDPCLLDISLPIEWTPREEKKSEGRPSWQGLSPAGRGEYLQWLAGGRRDEAVGTDILWLYAFGLERRIFVDGPKERFAVSERMAIVRELERLANLYADREYFVRGIRHILAAAWAVAHSPEDLHAAQIDFTDSCCPEVLPWYLASLAARREAIPTDVLMIWFQRIPENRDLCDSRDLSGVLADRFLSEFGEGATVTPTMDYVSIRYRALNPALGELVFPMAPLRDVCKAPDILDGFANIASDCRAYQKEYEAYRQQPGANPLGALLRLPIKMRLGNKTLRSFAQQLQTMMGKQSVIGIRVKDVFRLLGFKAPPQLNETYVDDITSLLETSAFQFAPNPRYHGLSFTLEDNLIITPSLQAPEVTPAFTVIVLLIRLGSIIAQCDENVSQNELEVLQKMILERKVLSDVQQKSLLLWLHWCMSTPQRVEDVTGGLADIDEGLKNHISKVLINVAMADGGLEERERETLITLHHALGLPSTWVDLGVTSAQGGIVIPKVDEESIKFPEDEITAKRSMHELRPVDGVDVSEDLHQALSVICDSPALEQKATTVFAAPKNDAPKFDIPAAKLDRSHQRLLAILAEHDEYDRLKLFKEAALLDLMGDRAMACINRYAVETIGTEILTDGDVVRIDTKRARELL